MVTPNGSGKSSFALAFQWLNQRRIKLNKDDAYNGDETNSTVWSCKPLTFLIRIDLIFII